MLLADSDIDSLPSCASPLKPERRPVQESPLRLKSPKPRKSSHRPKSKPVADHLGERKQKPPSKPKPKPEPVTKRLGGSTSASVIATKKPSLASLKPSKKGEWSLGH